MSGKSNAELSSYRVPPKPEAHRHGKGTGNAQTGAVEIVGPGTEGLGDRVVSRSGVSAFGGHSAHRGQSSDVDAGRRGPDRRGGEYKGSDSSRTN
jgi:hypothetical protein